MIKDAIAGHFYTVGIGPGDPGLLTLDAVKVIESADVIVAPRSEIAKSSLALDVVQQYIPEKTDVIEHVYPMVRDPEVASANWAKISTRVGELLEQGLSVAHITLGDPMIYSTAHYLLEGFPAMVTADRIHVIPGISAFQKAIALGQVTATIQNDRMLLMPASKLEEVEKALQNCETLVLYKAGKGFNKLCELLERYNLAASAMAVFYAGIEGREVVYKSLEGLKDVEPPGYMATVVIRCGHRQWESKNS